MTLDTAHIHDQNTILEIIDIYHHFIPVVHLSAKNETGHHLPLDQDCIEVASLLKVKNWQGTIILEYLPWHHYRVADDIQALDRFLFHDEPVTIIPPDNKYKDRPDCWGYCPSPYR